MSTTHHQVVGKCNSSEACEFWVKTRSGAKPCIFSGNVAPGVAAVGSLFPGLRASFALENLKKQTASEHFWKMRSANSESSICKMLKFKKIDAFGALLEDEAGKMCTSL